MKLKLANTKIKTYATLFFLTVVLDFLLYLFGEMNEIVNWDSPVHFRWVVFSVSILLLFAFLKNKLAGWIGLVFHFAIFALALSNQFFEFSETLNYNCMLFNLGLFTVYYFNVNE
ncbi:MAG: hypothetical protein OEV93_01720 [Candidatus Moranbacteria bacterium]|nr:hypothetical protein [Candidatus Moranbacteria bacterium]